MTDIRTMAFVVGYLAALVAAVSVLGAWGAPPPAANLMMALPLGVLAAMTWSVTGWSGPMEAVVSVTVWLSFAAMAAAFMVDWMAWEHLGPVALVAPLVGSRVAGRRRPVGVVAGDPAPVRQAA